MHPHASLSPAFPPLALPSAVHPHPNLTSPPTFQFHPRLPPRPQAALYTQGLKADPESSVLYSNRSAALLQLAKTTKALADAEQCIRLRPDWDKVRRRGWREGRPGGAGARYAGQQARAAVACARLAVLGWGDALALDLMLTRPRPVPAALGRATSARRRRWSCWSG